MIRTIDIHTHLKNTKGIAFQVGVHSLGIHPWELLAPFVESEVSSKFLELKKTFHSKILAIGECGLDRIRNGIVSITEQEKVLEWHLDWAQDCGRPIILHCVKAHSDLLMVLKQKKYTGKILMHDFAGNFIEAERFLGFDCYFSFGARLFRSNEKALEVIKKLPIERIFLETDNQTDFNIVTIYKKAQSLLGLSEAILTAKMEENLKNFFLDLENISSADVINDLSCSSSP